MGYFEKAEISALFDNESKYGAKFRFSAVTETQLKRAEEKLGYPIPASYRELLALQNGGFISDDLDESWLTVIYGIGETPEAEHGLEEMFDNWREEWEYPDIGIPFGETQSAGHDMYYMDFRTVNANGEPRIVRIDNEDADHVQIFFVAENLPAFLKLILSNQPIEETRLD